MKRFFDNLLLIIVFFSTAQFCMPATIEVEALTPFSSLNPSKNLDIVTKEKVDFKNGIIWEEGTVVKGQILDVRQPKRGKRDASFKFFPISYTYDEITKVNTQDSFVGRYSATGHIDKVKIAESAATTAGGIIFHIPFLSQGYSFAKGVVKNPEKNRFKSGAVQVYKDSPVSYIEEGKDINLKKGDIFYLKFKNDDDEDYPSKSHLLEVDDKGPAVTTTQERTPSSTEEHSTFTIYTDDPEDILHEAQEGLR